MTVKHLAAVLAGLVLAGTVAGPAAAAPSVSFRELIDDIGPLETYARQYASANPGDAVDELVLVYIRTANPAYDDFRWETLGGRRDLSFESYVAEQDDRNGTSASDLKQLRQVTLPNGEVTDAVHMFATMSLGTPPKSPAADLGGFAGDITDLMTDIRSVAGGPAAVQAAAAADFGNPNGGFSTEDLWADLDAVNLTALRAADPQTPYADLLTAYFSGLTERKRVDGFLTNRFPSTPRTQTDLRAAVTSAYTSNTYISFLEYDRGLSDLTAQRDAAIGVFAGYLAQVSHVIPVAVTSPAASSTVGTSTPTVAGTGEPGATVTVTGSGGRVVGTTTVDAAGAWSLTTATLPAGRAGLTVAQAAGGGGPTTAAVAFEVVLPRPIPVANSWVWSSLAVAIAVALVAVVLWRLFSPAARRRRSGRSHPSAPRASTRG
ncbi:Ig-like domain-containing protein [Leifsonia sp. NPDC077715]|uniref:Ig-like domain-containing protein n=1 Tax=Leifsonia sp. NPDC077715 TaxID=3155539 RepID=UPI00341ADD6D